MLSKIESKDAPEAIGPYSQAVRAGSFLFLSGQIPINPKTKKVEETSIEGQTRQVFANIEAILKAAGLGLNAVVRAEVYLQDMADFLAMNQVYAEYFSGPVRPARHTLEVAKLPLNVRIEISCIAFFS